MIDVYDKDLIDKGGQVFGGRASEGDVRDCKTVYRSGGTGRSDDEGEVRRGGRRQSSQTCTHTPCRTHIFLTHFPCVAYRHRVHAWLMVCAVRTSPLPDLTFSLLMLHPPSLLFPHGHLDTSFLSAPSVPNSARPRSAGQAHFRTSAEESGYLADPTHSTGYEPEEFDKITSADGDTTPINDPNCDDISDFSKTTRENIELFGVSTVFEASVSHVSHW